jgi:hypothetical protein
MLEDEVSSSLTVKINSQRDLERARFGVSLITPSILSTIQSAYNHTTPFLSKDFFSFRGGSWDPRKTVSSKFRNK